MAMISLELATSMQGEPVTLVPVAEGIRMCRDLHFAKLPAQEAMACIDGLGARDLWRARDFLARARLSRAPLTGLSDPALRALLRRSLQVGELVVLRRGRVAETAGDQATAKLRRLVRSVELRLRGRLAYAGRQYRLVVDVDLASVPDRGGYEVAARAEAVKVVDGIARQSSGELVALLAEVRGNLTPDWRPPLRPDGLVLLRRIVQPAGIAPEAGPALTPSQLQQLAKKKEWIEIEIVDEAGEPYGGAYEIELPDGAVRKGNFQQGFWADYDIDPGTCKLVLPKAPKGAETGAGSTFVAFRLVDAKDAPVMGRSYKLQLTDGTERTGTTEDGEIRVDGIDPGTCILSVVLDGDA
jgi:hypothetical protein